MSTAAAELVSSSVNGGAVEDRAHQKSFKRKYRKLRHKFKEVMKRSDELFKQEQLARQAIRRTQEGNTRVLDFLVDLNESEHIPKERRHNIGSPSRATPPRFLSPSLLANTYGDDPALLDPDGDVEEMELEEEGEEEEEERENEAVGHGEQQQNGNNSSDDDDEDDDEDKTPAGQGSKYNSDDDDDKEAYLEEIREFNYKRGIAGTPPRSVREKMKSDADRERKEAEKDAKKAAAKAVADKKRNGTNAIAIKQEEEDESSIGPEDTLQQQPALIIEDYRRGHTPEYLRSGSPFLMTLEEEEDWYNEIHEKYDGGIPPLEHPNSPSAAKAEGDPRNPVSVYCWLRKNQPQVFLQGEEVEGGKKPGRGRGGGRRKAIEVDSGDEGLAGLVKTSEQSKLAGAKRRRTTTNGSETVSVPSALGSGTGRGRGAKGGRKKAEGSPPAKRQRR